MPHRVVPLGSAACLARECLWASAGVNRLNWAFEMYNDILSQPYEKCSQEPKSQVGCPSLDNS